jgi:hypothetical protein
LTEGCEQVFESLTICDPQCLPCFQSSQDQSGQRDICPCFAEAVNTISMTLYELLALIDVPDGARQSLH